MTDWEDRAACRKPTHDPDWWWDNESSSEGRRNVEKALRICNNVCPVRDQCLMYALENGEGDGVYGGLTPRERKRLNR